MSNQKPWVIGLLVSNLVLLVAIAWLVLRSPEQPGVEPASDLAPAAATDVADAPAEETAPAAPSAAPAETEPTSASAPDPTATATEVPATAVPEPTVTPPPPEPTDTPAPTDTPTPEPTPVPTVPAVPPPAWLSYFNIFREMAGVPTVTEQAALTLGSSLHSKYMVVNDDPIAHAEDVNNPLYDEAGHLAAKNGNIFATSQLDADYVWGVNFWISGPFHLVPTLHPGLKTVGYGDYVEDTGNIHMAAVMDVRTDREYFPEGITYPIYFPKNGSETWVVRHSLFEWPEPFGNCPGYARPAGAPIVLQLGDGSLTPNVTSHTLVMGDQPIESCIFDETNYRNADAYAQEVGRTILDVQDAIVIMPKDPLPIDQTYTVQVVVNGETHTWSFSTRKGPPEQ